MPFLHHHSLCFFHEQEGLTTFFKKITAQNTSFSEGHFQPVIDDPAQPDGEKVKRLLFCAGKVFFDLHEGREERGQEAVALVRIEELNPFPWDEVEEVLEKYQGAEEIFWVQEEPQNMGSWDFTEPKIRKLLDNRKPVQYIGRRSTAATATGVQKVHLAEQMAIVETALEFT